MHSKRCSRAGVFCWSPEGVDNKGIIIADFAQHFDPISIDIQSRIEFLSVKDIYGYEPLISKRVVPCQYRFNELAWIPPMSDAHPSGLIFGGTEDGTVVFFDADQLINQSSLSVLSSRRDHHGHVLSVDYSADHKWAISAGGSAQLLLWDLTNLTTPFSPGVPNFPDQIKRVRWNLSMEQIVASVSSHRCSIWDIRRPGTSVFEFGEVGGGCDWADISWNPLDSSTLVICSQSDAVPLMQKWDLRYPTAPVMDYAIHHKGVTAINWHKKDPRLLLSASHDGNILILNPISGELVGRVGCEQSDWIRSISWSEVKPNLLAVQYFQHPVQISSIEPLTTEKGTSFPLELSLVPSWVTAAPVGVSFALGGKVVTHYKQWDDTSMSWKYCVDIKHISIDSNLCTDAIELQNACDSRQLGAYCEDRALASNDHNLLLLWTFLSAQVTNHSRREYIRLLGFNDEDSPVTSLNLKISLTSNDVSHVTEGLSRITTSQENGRTSVLSDVTTDTSIREVFEQQTQIDWEHIDYDSWNMLDMMVEGKDQQVVDLLLERKDFPSAFLVARHQPLLMNRVIDKYLSEDLSTPLRFLAILATNNLEQLIDSFPIKEWKRLLGLILAKEDRGRISKTMKRIAEKLAGGNYLLSSALPAILAGDVQLLLMANRELPLRERVHQAIVLQMAITNDYECTIPNGEDYEQVILEYCNKLVANGVLYLAWRLVNKVQSSNEQIILLRHDLFEVCGGKEKIKCDPPVNPYQDITRAYSMALKHKEFNSIAQHPSSLYQSNYAINNQLYSMPSHISGNITSNFGVGIGHIPAIPTAVGSQSPMNNSPGYASSITPNMSTGYALNTHSGFIPSQSVSTGIHGCNQVPSNIPPPLMEIQYSSQCKQSVQPPLPSGYNSSYNERSTQFKQIGDPLVGSSTYVHQNQDHLTSAMPNLHNMSEIAQQRSDLPIPTKSYTPGWNDPPPLPGKRQEVKAGCVMEVHWKPLEQPPASLPGITQSGMTGLVSSNSIELSPEIILNAEDRSMMDRLYNLVEAVLAINRTPMGVHKAVEAKHRLENELAPRLASGRLSLVTRQLLWQCCDQTSRGEFREAQRTCAQMVQNSGDFVEVSAFLPALKSLLSVAQSSLVR